jgi:hypothetical protein
MGSAPFLPATAGLHCASGRIVAGRSTQSLEVMRTVFVALVIAIASCAAFCKDTPPKRDGEVTYQYEEPEATEFYRLVLEAMGISYRAETHEGKPVYWWLPKNDAEDAEVRGRVSQFMFTSTGCLKKYRTSPSTPAGTVTRCEK